KDLHIKYYCTYCQRQLVDCTRLRKHSSTVYNVHVSSIGQGKRQFIPLGTAYINKLGYEQ
ncbi:hypothetical protein EDC94DRAFT_497854, partial [Helicostylum pulchrum]